MCTKILKQHEVVLGAQLKKIPFTMATNVNDNFQTLCQDELWIYKFGRTYIQLRYLFLISVIIRNGSYKNLSHEKLFQFGEFLFQAADQITQFLLSYQCSGHGTKLSKWARISNTTFKKV